MTLAEGERLEEGVDGTQFKGWKFGNAILPCSENIPVDRPEWNSCTGSFSGDYYMNYRETGEKTSQRSADVQSYVQFSEVMSTECPIDWDSDGDIDDGGCWNGSGARQISLTGEYMDLYELDANEFDDYVTTLNYLALVINTSCDGWTCTPASSPWRDSNSNSIASAQIRASLIDMSFNDPNNCCQNGVNTCS